LRVKISIILICCAVIMFLLAEIAISFEKSDLNIKPRVLEVSTFFTGSSVTITGKIPSSCDAIVEIIGPLAHDFYDVKGRLGPFWMTREKVRLDGAPCLYILLLPTSLDWSRNTRVRDLGIGLEYLKSVISINNGDKLSDDMFKMFLGLKSSEGLYGEEVGAISYQGIEKGRKGFIAAYTFPSSVVGGRYRVKVTSLKNGVLEDVMTGEFEVKEVGFIKYVHDLATNRSLIYGISSVLIALFAGALMGMLFKRTRGGH
jgi:hypothetical protein